MVSIKQYSSHTGTVQDDIKSPEKKNNLKIKSCDKEMNTENRQISNEESQDIEEFPTITKKTASKIAKLIANKLDLELYLDKKVLDSKTQYYSFSYSVFNDTPLLNFLPWDIETKKVPKGAKSEYSFNLKTLRPTQNSKQQYDIPSNTAKAIKELIYEIPK